MTIYYFFPTVAPASEFNSQFFVAAQYATATKFHQMHSYQPITTADGGLIGFPSFHVIWGLLCIYLVKDIRILFIPLIIINVLMIVSCVLLGWHYISDVLGGFLIVYLSYWIYNKYRYVYRHPTVLKRTSQMG